MFVGDVLLSAREAVPDLPGVIPNPLATEVVFGTQAGSPSWPAGVYYCQATYVNLWGETAPGPEAQITVPANSVINANVLAVPYLNFITSVNVYIGPSSGGEIQQFSFSAPFAAYYPLSSASPYIVATPPFGNSAFLLDTGGTVASASQTFRWLSDALNRLSALNGGIPDMSGFGTQFGKANYQMPGDWQTLSDAWYDGYPINLGSSSLVFRHNVLTALSGLMAYTQVADTLVVELFAQPIRTAGIGGLSVGMNPLSAVAQTAGMSGWVLPFGLAQLGNPPTYEIVAYTMSGNNLMSLVRGLGGTNAQTWPVGTPVSELNCMFKGMRAAQMYTPGQAANTLRLPSSWVPLIHLYVLSRYRRIEQQEDEATKLNQLFEAGAKEATKKKPAVGDRQVQPQDQVAVDVYPLLSSTFGGALIP